MEEVKDLKMVEKMKKRLVPLFKVAIDPDTDYTQLVNMPDVEDAVMKEVVIAIKDGLHKRKRSISLFNVSYTQYSIEIEKSQWSIALEKAIKYHENRENYEKCAECRDLIKKLS